MRSRKPTTFQGQPNKHLGTSKKVTVKRKQNNNLILDTYKACSLAT